MLDKFNNKYRIASSRLAGWDYGLNSSYFVTICTHHRICFFGDVIDEQMVLNDIGLLANDYWLQIPEKFPFAKLGNHVVMPNHVHGIIIIDKPDDENEQTQSKETQLIASLQDNPHVETRFIASKLSNENEQTQLQQTQLIASLQDNPHVETRIIASPLSDANVQTRFIASLPIEPNEPIGGITGNHNPMLHDNLSKIIRWYKGRTAFESRKINIDFAWQSRFHDHIIRNDESFQKISNYITNNPSNWNKDQFYK